MTNLQGIKEEVCSRVRNIYLNSGLKPYERSLAELLDAGTVGDPMEASMGDINCMEDMEERLNLDTKKLSLIPLNMLSGYVQDFKYCIYIKKIYKLA